MTPDKLIIERLETGREFMRPFAQKMRRIARRYRDSSANSVLGGNGQDDGRAQDQAVGEINNPAINLRQKIASIAIAVPDFTVTCGDPENAQIVRKWMRDLWRDNNWARLTRRTLLERSMGGMGFLAELWDPADEFVLEHAAPLDLAYDPHTFDATWNRPRWGFRQVKLPRAEAKARYGAGVLKLDEAVDSWDERRPVRGNLQSDVVGIWTYWDNKTEAEMYGDKVLDKTENRYGRVPLLVMQGDLNPEGEFSLGDFDQVLGAYELLRRIQNILNASAQHGGGVAWARMEYIDETVREAFINGDHQGLVPITGAVGEQVFGYTKTMDLNEALLRALAYAEAGIDSDQGITILDRGVISPGQNPDSATQAALMSQRSGVRGSLNRTDYETFCEEVARECIRFHTLFALDPRGGQITPDKIALWRALRDVQEIRIVEESASWKDPISEQQSSMQLLNVVSQLTPLLLELAKMGMVNRIPNIPRFLDDALRAFRRRHMEDYFIEITPQVQQTLVQSSAPPEKTGKSPGEMINYKDAPPDVQRQMEAQAGLQPSQMSNTEPDAAGQAEHDRQHQAALQAMQHGHDVEMHYLQAEQARQDREHAAVKNLLDYHQQSQQAQMRRTQPNGTK